MRHYADKTRELRKRRQHAGIIRLMTMKSLRGRDMAYVRGYSSAWRETREEIVEYWHPAWAKRRAKEAQEGRK